MKKKQTPKTGESPPPDPEVLAEAHVSRPSWIVCVAIGLFLTRYLLPTEGSGEGHTAVLCAAWIALAALVSWLDWRNGTVWRVDWKDAAILGVTAPPIVSGIFSPFMEIEQRAAQNILLEWISLAVSLLLLRRLLSEAGLRRVLAAGIVSVLTAVAVHGLWQHYVWYPQTAQQLVEYEQLEALTTLTGEQEQRKQDLLRTLGPEFVSADPVARNMMRDRLVNSTEPLGFFALANTLAGILGVAIVFVALSRNPTSRPALAFRIVAGSLLLVTFLLTKSRTAYLAAFLTAACVVLLVFGRRVPWKQVGAAVAASVGIVVLLLLTGGLDLAVLTESSRSLAYRIEYWTATSSLIGNNWLTGVGLGNFREEYLQYKLAGSSEEILDPHNWLLEAWATSGILGLIGAVVSIAALSAAAFRRIVTLDEELQIDTSGRVLPPIAIAGFLALVWSGFPIRIDEQVVIAVVVALFVASIAKWTWSESDFIRGGLGAATLLTVHLLASGGFGMPAVLQMLLACLTVFAASTPDAKRLSDRSMHVVQATLLVLLLGAILLVIRPNLARDRWLTDAETRAYFESDPVGAIASLKRAHAADPLSHEPLLRLASLYASQQRKDEARDAAMQAVAKSPQSPTLKQWAASLLLRVREEQLAADLLAEAVADYPNGSDVHADAAEVFSKVGDERAVAEAVRAIELDDLNRQAGHTDKVFPDERRELLLRIAGAQK